MGKADWSAIHNHANDLRRELTGGFFRHYKGGEYIVTDVSVFEPTGEILITYQVPGTQQKWTRTEKNFFETIPRFVRRGAGEQG